MKSLVQSKDYDATYHDINEEINTLISKPMSIKLEKCEECKMKVNPPCVIFRCKHIYHSSCLIDKNNKSNEQYCPKCNKDKMKIEENLRETNKIYKNLNNIDSLGKELNEKEDIIEYLEQLYGKGLANINLN